MRYFIISNSVYLYRLVVRPSSVRLLLRYECWSVSSRHSMYCFWRSVPEKSSFFPTCSGPSGLGSGCGDSQCTGQSHPSCHSTDESGPPKHWRKDSYPSTANRTNMARFIM